MIMGKIRFTGSNIRKKLFQTKIGWQLHISVAQNCYALFLTDSIHYD